MKAFAMVEPVPGGARLVDLPDPSIDDAAVLVRIEAAGVCGTDVSLLDWAPGMAARAQGRLPLAMGHEGAGVVQAIGRDVRGLAVGDRVAPVSIQFCRTCLFCREGRD
ncbi:MAG: alcohol dehydrogenase catalytic domain-containing protein [Solirubrobacterales bacterium]